MTKTKSTTRAAIYVRISQDSTGRAAGVRRQEKECRELAKARGWDVVEIYRDNDTKATARKRPGYEAMLEAVRSGKVEAIIAWHSDRFYRRTKDLDPFIDLIEEYRTKIATVTAGDLDLSTASGRGMARILTSIAQMEVERAGERQKARWRQRKEDGKLVTLGRRPLGLKRDGDTMVEEPAEADAIRDAVRKLLGGASLYSVTQGLATRGVQSPCGKDCSREHPHYIRAAHLKRALLSDHLVRYGVITEREHRAVVAKFTKTKRGPGRPPKTYLLSGLARCSLCGSKMAASSGAYHCQAVSCGKVGVKARYADGVVVQAMQWLLDPQDPTDPRVPEHAAAEHPDDDRITEQIAGLEDRIAKLADNVDLSEAVLARRVKALEDKRDELSATLGTGSKTRRQWLADWVSAGCPEPDPAELHDEAVELLESVTIAPAKTRGSKIFDASRVSIVLRTVADAA